MRPVLAIVAGACLAAVAWGAAARDRDARHFTLPQYDSAAMEGLLAAPNYDTRSLDRMVDARIAPGGDVIDWRYSDAAFDNGDSVDHWTLAWGGTARDLPPGLAATLASQSEDERFWIGYSREWPALFSGTAGDYDFDISPHAGVGLSDAGRSAEAGATLRFGDLDPRGRARRALGMTAVDGREFRGRGRWYLFAALSGKAVGVNMLRDPLDGGWRPAGLSSDFTSGFMTSAQAGVAWRQGPTQASLGYVRRKVRITAVRPDLYPNSDNALAFSFAIKPEL